MKRNPTNRRKKKRPANRNYIFAISVILVLVLSVQMARLYQKNKTYESQEDALRQELEEEQAKGQELSEYEEYINSQEYVENTAKQKLGMIYNNEIIFREK